MRIQYRYLATLPWRPRRLQRRATVAAACCSASSARWRSCLGVRERAEARAEIRHIKIQQSRRRLSVSPLQLRVTFAARFSYARGGVRVRMISPPPPTRDFGRVADGQHRPRPLLASILILYYTLITY